MNNLLVLKKQFFYVKLAFNLCLCSIALNYLQTAIAAELNYKANAESSIDLLEGRTSQELDSDRLSLVYTEAIAPIIVADAEAKAEKFLDNGANDPDGEPIVVKMSAMGKYAARIDYGLLQGISQTQIETAVPSSDQLPILSGKASSVQNLSWSDKLTVVSSTLPKGKTVRLKCTLTFTRSLSKDKLGESKAAALFGIYTRESRKKIEIAIGSDRLKGSETTTQSQIIEVKVGQTIDLVGSLELLAKVSNHNSHKSPSNILATANAENSAKFYIDPIDSDISYTTESRQDYLSNAREQRKE